MALLTLSVLFVFRLPDVSRLFLLIPFPVQYVVTVGSRALLRHGFEAMRKRGYNTRYTVVLGAGARGRAYATRIENHPELGLKIRGFLDDDAVFAADLPANWAYLGHLANLETVPPDRPMILTVAALEARKRVGLIIERLADDLRGDWTMVVAGDGRLHKDMRRQVAEAGLGGRVLLLGARSDVPHLMAAADVLVHATEAEGVPQVGIQALAAGLPVVATDVIGLREVPEARPVIGAADGSDFSEHVTRSLRAPRVSVPVAALRPWSTAAVEAEMDRLHGDLGLAR